MLPEFLQLLYYFIPAYAANALPPLLAKLPFLKEWKTPIDLGKTWRGKPLLGKNKTVRGALLGTLLGGLLFLLQQRLPLYEPFYSSLPWYAGLLLAFGAIVVGDCGESLIKRRLAKRPGHLWFPWDEIDYTLGALLLTFWLFWPGWLLALLLLIFNGFLSGLTHRLGYAFGLLKDRF